MIRGMFLGMIVAASAHGQVAVPDVVCSEGSGSFETQFHTGVGVRVRAGRSGSLAARSCDAILSSGKQEIAVATGVAQLDVDALGIDLGLGPLVATFQVKQSDSDCCMTYLVYSVQRVPRLLRTISGGEFFSAADTDLDGRVEIWTKDAAVLNGFEGLSLAELETLPTVVLRFSGARLLDATAEFRPYIDQEITRLRAATDPQDRRAFKNSDGRLEAKSGLSAEHLNRMRRVKAVVLGIVWSYLYSGREQEAWRALADMWPAQDVDRIRTAIWDVHARGILAQVDGIATKDRARGQRKAPIFDAITEKGSTTNLGVVPPEPILLQQPLLPDAHDIAGQTEVAVDLVIDSAGKVRSARQAGNPTHVAGSLIASAEKWKFIPAFKDGYPVASRLRLVVSPKQ